MKITQKTQRFRWPIALILILFYQAAFSQLQVKGAVTDQETGDPLLGVNIIVQGTTQGTLTDFDGNYEIEVPDDNSVLVFTYLGYKSSEIVVGTQGNIDVQLIPDFTNLEEVVLIGYGQQDRESVTGAISTIKSEDFNSGTINDPMTLVAGKVAGLSISQPTADPNSTADFSLRGPATISGNSQPLIVIDGVPGGDLQSIAPQDIASIDVLKDASAAAIYGSRATAGVIIFTTKKGAAGKTKINYSTYISTNLVTRKYDVLNAAQYRLVADEYGFAKDDAGYDTDWFDAVTRTPVNFNHNLSISGGGEKTTFYAGINYIDLEGMDLMSDRRSVTGTFRLNTKALNDKLNFSAMVTNTFHNRDYANYGAIAQSLKMNPTFPVKNPDGTFYERPDIPYGLQWNPVASLYNNNNNSKESRLLSNLKVDYEFFTGFTGSLSYSFTKNQTLSGSYSSNEDFFQKTSGTNGQASRDDNSATSNILETTLMYNKSLGDHTFDILGGYSYQNNLYEGFSAGNNNFNTNVFLYNNLGAGSALNNLTPNFNRGGVFMNSYASERSLIAYFGRLIYDYQKKYLINLSIRREGASVLGADNKWGTFSGISGGWVISKENFLLDNKFVKNLKLRAGYGATGNQESLSPYQSLATIGPYFNGTQNGFFGEPGNSSWIQPYGPTINPNPQLRWETKHELNIGLDFNLFNNGWLSGSLDYYNRTIENLVGNYSAQLPSQIFPSIFANAGEMVNEGVELALGARIFDTEKFQWSANFTGSYNTNEVVSMTSEQFKGSAQDITAISEGTTIQRLAPGQPVAVFYGRVFDSFNEDGQWLFKNSEGNAVEASEIGQDDFTYLGNSIPRYSLGLTNNFKIGRFDASMLIRSALGFNVVNGKRIYHENITYFSRQNLFTSALDDGIQADPMFSSYYIENGNYVKLDNLTVGYTLPLQQTGPLQSIRFYITGANLATITKFSGTDPEMGLNYYPSDPGAEVSDGPGVESYYNYYPSTMTLTFGLNASF